MIWKGRPVAALLLVLVLARAQAVPRSYADGPDPGYTGGFNEPTCQHCHMGNDLNDPAGAVAVELPDGFEPGKPYDIRIRLTRPHLERGGFQLSARVADGPAAGSDAGTLQVTGTSVQLVKSPGRGITYAQHSPLGTRAAQPGSLLWSVRWIAPKEALPVRFDVAANASNDDDSPMDDYIYTAAKEVSIKEGTSGLVAIRR